jgi:uncharacterized protein YuzE
MSANKHVLVVRSEKPPVIEMDLSCGAAYIRFSNSKIARTVEQSISGPIVTVDLDKAGGVVGVEALFWDEFQIAKLLKIAKVDAPRVDFSRAKFRATPRHAEEAEVAFA